MKDTTYLAQCGPVLPLRYRGKTPLTTHGVHDATRDPVQIDRWLRRWPRCNWGIATGHRIVVVDIDPRSGGLESWSRLAMQHNPDDLMTASVDTGGGGWHLFYEGPGIAGGIIAEGIDFKGLGGYVVAPGSIHPNGTPYTWRKHVRDWPILPLPDWIRACLRPKVKVGRPIGNAAESFVARAFDAAGWLGHQIDPMRIAARCPFAERHSDGRGLGADSSTVVLSPTRHTPLGAFRCQHSHCTAVSTRDALLALPREALIVAGEKDIPAFNRAIALVRGGAL